MCSIPAARCLWLAKMPGAASPGPCENVCLRAGACRWGGGRCTPAYGAEGAARAHSTAEAHLKRIAELEALVEELRGKEALSQANLQRAWAELSEQRKAVAELVGAAQSEALEREVRRLVITPAGASESGAGEGQGGTVEGSTGQRDGSAALGARWKRSWILTRAVQAR